MDQKEKNELVKKLLDTEDDAILDQIKVILGNDEEDFYDELPAHVKESIEQGLRDSKEGRVRPHDEVMKELRAKYKL